MIELEYEFEEGSWTYEVEDPDRCLAEQLTEEYIYQQKQKGIQLSEDQKKQIKEYNTWLTKAILNDDDIERLLEAYEDELKDEYEQDAYEEMLDNIQCRQDDIDDYNRMRADNCRL